MLNPDALPDLLLPCPFCGGEPEARHWDWPYVRHQIRCSECRATASGRRVSLEEAAAVWNTRAALTKARTPAEPAGTSNDEVERLFVAIAHGDEIHRAWLREALDCYFAGRPIPPPRDAKAALRGQP